MRREMEIESGRGHMTDPPNHPPSPITAQEPRLLLRGMAECHLFVRSTGTLRRIHDTVQAGRFRGRWLTGSDPHANILHRRINTAIPTENRCASSTTASVTAVGAEVMHR